MKTLKLFKSKEEDEVARLIKEGKANELQSDDILIAINDNPMLIGYIDKPSYLLQYVAVTNDYKAFKLINNPSNEITNVYNEYKAKQKRNIIGCIGLGISALCVSSILSENKDVSDNSTKSIKK